MWKIGNIEIKSHVVLAPMAGISFLSYREFMKPFGVGVSVTEMVSDNGLVYNNQSTLEYIQTSPIDRPVGIQLFGHDKETLMKAMDIVLKANPNFDFFDINLGCPVNKVTKTGAGSALLKDPKYLEDLMSALVKHSPKPVTAKIRLGWNEDSINFLDNIKALENAGVSMIALHVRTTAQCYGGSARYELAKDLGEKMSVPLVISGDIFSLEDAIKAKEITKATAVMVARGGVGNPHLVKQINHYFNTGEKLPNISIEENIENLRKFVDMIIAQFGENRAMRILRGLAPRFFNGYPNSKKVKCQLAMELNTKEQFDSIIDKYLDELKNINFCNFEQKLL